MNLFRIIVHSFAFYILYILQIQLVVFSSSALEYNNNFNDRILQESCSIWKCKRAIRNDNLKQQARFCCQRKKEQCTISQKLNGCAGETTTKALCCQERPMYIKIQMIGGSCQDSKNSQENKSSCTGGEVFSSNIVFKEKGTSTTIPFVFDSDPNDVKTQGFLQVGDIITVGNGERFSSDTTATLEGLEVSFHSSCSSNLFLGDQFGPLRVVGWESESEKLEDCFMKSNPPTPAPQGCKDTTDLLRLNRNEERGTCADLKLNRFAYLCLNNDDIADLCPVTCGLCEVPSPSQVPSPSPTSCIDRSGFIPDSGFTCSDIVDAPNRSWRCKQNETRKHCPVMCNACSDCSNNSGLPPSGGLSCNELEEKAPAIINQRCTRAKYKNHCPLTCGACPCFDKEGTPFQDNSLMSCLDIQSRPNACNNLMYREHCPVTCNACPGATFPPSKSPSNLPSQSPSDFPVVTVPPRSNTDSPTQSPSDFPVVTVPPRSNTDSPTKSPSHQPTKNPIDSGCIGCGCTTAGCGSGCVGCTPGVGCTTAGCGYGGCSSSILGCGSIGGGCTGLGPSCMNHACYHPTLKCTNACGNHLIMNSLECRCKHDPSVICDPYICPNTNCRFCTYWCKYHTPFDYNQYCPLAPWGRTVHASMIP